MSGNAPIFSVVWLINVNDTLFDQWMAAEAFIILGEIFGARCFQKREIVIVMWAQCDWRVDHFGCASCTVGQDCFLFFVFYDIFYSTVYKQGTQHQSNQMPKIFPLEAIHTQHDGMIAIDFLRLGKLIVHWQRQRVVWSSVSTVATARANKQEP